METRATSIQCYNQIKEEGLLSKRRFEVYEAIFKKAPCSSAEAMFGMLNSSNVLTQSRARFTELRESGVIYEKGEKKCSITGRNVIEWDLTDKLPIKFKPAKTEKQKRTEAAIEGLRELYTNKNRSNLDWKKVSKLIIEI
jgi:hypothetical protein